MTLWRDALLPPLVAGWINAQGARRDDDQRRDFIRLLEDQGPPPQGISLHLGNGGNAALAAVLSTIPPRA